MKYQLVIQCRAAARDFDHLVAFEGSLTAALGDSAEVDGHDFGSEEFNVFVLTDDPIAIFQRIQEAVKSLPPPNEVKVAYRDLLGEDFTILWPPDSKEFSVA